MGGRWSGRILKLKKGATSGIIGQKAWCVKTQGYDAALKKDIDFEAMYREDKDWAPYAFVKDSKWVGRGDMGWFGISTNNAPKEEWAAKVRELIESLPDDTLISMYDCHI